MRMDTPIFIQIDRRWPRRSVWNRNPMGMTHTIGASDHLPLSVEGWMDRIVRSKETGSVTDALSEQVTQPLPSTPRHQLLVQLLEIQIKGKLKPVHLDVVSQNLPDDRIRNVPHWLYVQTGVGQVVVADVMGAVSGNAFDRTRFLTIFDEAMIRQPSFPLHWLSWIGDVDPELWWAMWSLSREEVVPQSAGIVAHWRAERTQGRPIDKPQVGDVARRMAELAERGVDYGKAAR